MKNLKKVKNNQDKISGNVDIQEINEPNTKTYLTVTKDGKENTTISKYNEIDILHESDFNSQFKPEITENFISVPEETKRRLFMDDAVDNVNKKINITNVVIVKPSAPNPFKNKTIFTGLCFTCVNNVSRTHYGVKCDNCARTYHIKCISKNKMKSVGKNTCMCNVCINNINM